VIMGLVAIVLLLTIQLAQMTTQAEVVPNQTIWTFATEELVEIKHEDFILTSNQILVAPKSEQTKKTYELETGSYIAYIHNYDDNGVLNIEQVQIIQN
ncbi:MAG: hypothetical protein ACRC5Q_02555, partial [Culicoidibacterales bacterium]